MLFVYLPVKAEVVVQSLSVPVVASVDVLTYVFYASVGFQNGRFGKIDVANAFPLPVVKQSEELYVVVAIGDDEKNMTIAVEILRYIRRKRANLDNFRGDAKLSTWLYKIAINESITFVNKKKAMNQLSIDDDESFLVNQLESDEWFDGDEAQINLQKAIATLPEKQRLVFNLRYYDEMKYDEMSEILGTSEGALKASYHHAVKKIEQFLGETN